MEYNSHRTLTNTAWSVISYSWPILFSILITPVIVRSLGIKDFGIYTFFNTVISMMGLLDLGISTAVSKYLAEYYGRNDLEKIRSLMGTASSIFSVVGLVGLIIFFLGAFLPFYGGSVLNSYSSFSIGIISAGILFALSSVSTIYTITFTALQRFDISSKLGMILLAIQQISILVMVLAGQSINGIFIVQAIIAFISLVVQKYLAQKILPELPKKMSWDKSEAIKCYKFGTVTFINGIATVSLTYLDRLIMPFFLGPSSLTYYSLPGNITSRIPGFSNSLSNVLFPMASSLQGAGDKEKIKNLYIRSFRLITVIAAAITVTTIAYSHQILQYWISPDLAAKATTAMIILAVTNFVLALLSPLSNFLLGLGKLKFLTTFSIGMAVINLVLLVILLPIAGINGAAWAYLLSLFPAIYMFYFTERHYLSLSDRKKYYRKTVSGNILVSMIIFGLSTYLFSHLIFNLLTVILVGGMTILLYIILYWAFRLFEPEDVRSVKLFAGRLFIKEVKK